MNMQAPDIGFGTAILQDIGADQLLIDKVEAMLAQNATAVAQSHPDPTAAAAFGVCESGLDLDAQTAKAPSAGMPPEVPSRTSLTFRRSWRRAGSCGHDSLAWLMESRRTTSTT